jgi:hypothetical protein
MKGQYDRVSLLFCNFDEVARKGNDMLKMNHIGFLLSQEIRENLVKERVVIKNPGIRDPGQIIDHPCHPQPIHFLFKRSEFIFLGVLFPTKNVNLVSPC